MEFKFYDNFFDAINLLPEGEREKACYEFCKYGITGELPEDRNLAMFCLGVSVSVQKYQGRGGKRDGAGRPPIENQKKQKNQKNQKNHNEQTETITETETETITEAEAKKESEWRGFYKNVHLTSHQYGLLLSEIANEQALEDIIEELSSNIAQKKEKSPPYDENYPDMHFATLKAYWRFRKLNGFKKPQTKEDKAQAFKNELDELTLKYRLKEAGSG